MPLRIRVALSFALLTALAAVLGRAEAQDKIDGTKAKAFALESLKKVKVDKPGVFESDNFVVVGTLTDDKAKALAGVLEKAYAVGRKAAKFDDKDTAWKGKLVVYYLPDQTAFRALVRRAFEATPDDGPYANFKFDPPVLVDPAELPGKPTDADLFFNTAARVNGELLKAKGTGTQEVPGWLRDGFGRVTAMRAEGTTAKRYTAYKSAAKAAVAKGAKAEDVWSGAKNDALANSFAEFLAFGPKAADFGRVIDALKPSEEVQEPTLQAQGFAVLGWKDVASADAAWKRWVQTGK
jgi:hypothetical protein